MNKEVKKEVYHNDEMLNSLKEFKKEYPSSTSADLQTFIMGYKSAIADYQEHLQGAFEAKISAMES